MMKKTKQTKFPIARIKKIMQTDEDVGKVAMATPVLVSKALELFMANIVEAAVKEARETGGKKLTAYHLKRCVQKDSMYDWLMDTVSSIPDPVEPVAKEKKPRAPRAKKIKAPADGDEDEEAEEKPKPKRRKKAAAPVAEEDEEAEQESKPEVAAKKSAGDDDDEYDE